MRQQNSKRDGLVISDGPQSARQQDQQKYDKVKTINTNENYSITQNEATFVDFLQNDRQVQNNLDTSLHINDAQNRGYINNQTTNITQNYTIEYTSQNLYTNQEGLVNAQANDKSKSFCCKKKKISPLGDYEAVGFDQLTSEMPTTYESFDRASKNWEKVRKSLRKIVMLGIMIQRDKFQKQEKTTISSYVIHPDNNYKFPFDLCVDIAYIISFFLTPFVVAFHAEPLIYTRWFEFIIDIILIINLVMNFFTGYRSDGQVILKPKAIISRYLKTDFIFDVIATIPGFVTVESYKYIYYVKIVRFTQIDRLFAQINNVLGRIMKILIHSQSIENFFSLFNYVTAFYFVTTTATTVGYGDYSAFNKWEKLYLIFLEFTGICTFSIITGNITSLQSMRQIADIIQEKQDEIQGFLFDIDLLSKKNIDGDTYDQAGEYIKVSYLEGVKSSFKEGNYYKLLPPKLKDRFVLQTLDKYYDKFFYFFNDIQQQNYAPQTFIRKILVNLDCQIFEPNVEILKGGHEVNKLYFVYKGAVLLQRIQTLQVLVKPVSAIDYAIEKGMQQMNQRESIESENHRQNRLFKKIAVGNLKRGQKYIDCIAILPEGSFFGDYQILFNINSNYTFTSMSQMETWCMTISSSKFLQKCEEFPHFHSFLQQRALLRRNHFKQMELKLEQQNDSKLTNDTQMETQNLGDNLSARQKFEEDSDKEQIMKVSENNHLMQHSLVELNSIERPHYKLDQQKIHLNFTLPMLRMYVSSVENMSLSSGKYLKNRLNRFREFFKLSESVTIGTELSEVKNEYKMHEMAKKKPVVKKQIKAPQKIVKQSTGAVTNKTRQSQDWGTSNPGIISNGSDIKTMNNRSSLPNHQIDGQSEHNKIQQEKIEETILELELDQYE